MEQFFRSNLIIKEENTKLLMNKTILLCGVGGVGSYALEALIRMGIGHIILVDHDTVNTTNINRQIIALHSTVGKLKVDVAKERCMDIFPNAIIDTYPIFINKDNIETLFKHKIDYIIDAIDTVSAKLLLIEKANELNIPIISSMGTGNKLNPLAFKVADISKTNVCPLARVMRNELKKRGISKVKCVYSEELPVIQTQTPASIAFVPSVTGLLIASEVIKDLMK